MNYFTIKSAIAAHDNVICLSGGLPGIKNKGQLESILEHIQNDDYYPTFEEKLCHLVFSIIKFHMFADGNKRTSIVLGTYFLNINFYGFYIDAFMEEMEDIVVKIADNQISKEEYLEYLNHLLND